MNKATKNILALSLICAIVAILMAVTNYITAPIIKENQEKAENAALAVVMPDGGSFTTIDISEFTLPATVTNAYKAENGGFVLKLSTTGFDKGMVILCGVDANGVVTGATCLESKETLGHEKTYGENFVGLTLDGVRAVDTISSATKTTSAYRAAIVDAINAATILGGGDADIRDEEEIFRDELAAKLPEAEGKFTRLFITEVLDGVTAIYSADNGAGSVYLVGKKMIAITAKGEVLGEVAEADKAKVLAAEAILKASSKTAVDISTLKLPESVVALEKTASGNYIFTLHAKGITYDPALSQWYTPTPIVIHLAMTSGGRIIDCDTISQGESEGYGDACAKDSFTDQLIGHFSGSYTNIDGISGSTITTNGYLAAIGDAYDALEILQNTEFLDISTLGLPESVKSVEKKADGNYVFILYGKGITYAYPEWYTPTPIVIALTVTSDGKIVDCKTLSQGESAGYGDACQNDSFTGQFTDKNKDNFREVDGISGSTITTNGYLDAIGDAFTALAKLVGRTAIDISTMNLPESVQSVAMTGAGEYVFTLHAKGITYDPALSQWYTPTPIVISLTMTPDGKIVDCITLSQGESKGYGDACAEPSFTGQFHGKTGETYREIDGISGSTITTNGYLDAIGDAYTALDKLIGRTSVDISGLALPESVKALEKNAAGDYIFTLHAKGITYDPALSQWYTPTPIVISLTMTPDGKIVDCKTLSQGESKGYGDACAEPAFTGQFTDKNKDNFREIDGISGSTITTNGYLDAIGDAFTALTTLKGGDGQ